MRLATLIVVGLLPGLVAANALKEIESAYLNFNAAMKARDLKKVMAFTTPDFKLINASKVVFSRIEVRTNLEQTLKQFKNITSITTKIDSFKSDKLTVIHVRSTSVFKAEIVNPSTKKVGVFESKSTSDDVWHKTAAGWRIKESRIVKEENTLDGRKVGA